MEVISGLTAEEAKSQLVDSLKNEAKTDAMAYIQTTIEEAKLTARQEARKIIINTIQRIGTEEAIDNCVSVFNLESDDVKDVSSVVKDAIYVLWRLPLEWKLL